MLPLRWHLIQILLCIFNLEMKAAVKKNKEICTDFRNIGRVKMGYCDNFLISTLYQQLQSLRSINKYLKRKRDLFTETSCSEAIVNGEGDYLISSPDPKLKPFWVYCIKDSKNGSAWTVIQRRTNDSVSFGKKWEAYEKGFGHLHGSFWLGLEKIYALTSSQPYELQIEFTNINKQKSSAYYEHFGIGSKSRQYALQVIGKFNGNAGNALYSHQGIKFSTSDQINEAIRDCNETKISGWWIPEGCGFCNLNGRFTKISADKIRGIFWGASKSTIFNMIHTEMSIRAKFSNCN